MKKKALGRGLKSLIPEAPIVPMARAPRSADVMFLKVSEIHANPHQPRQQINAEKLHELAESIRAKGLMQPIMVRRLETGYELIAGERRLRAVQSLGHLEVPAVVRERISDRESLELS